MKQAFPEHFVGEPERQAKLWANCMFVLDTNVLLDLYRFSDTAKEALFKVMESLGDRLWIPYQVAAEYFDNRLSVIEAQSEAYAKSINGLKVAKDRFNSGSRHPFVSDEVFDKFIASYDLMIEELEGKQKIYLELVNEDLIKQKIGDILNGRVGEPYPESKVQAIAEEGEQRYSEKIPPGFEDGGKMPEATTSKLKLKKFGDLILWKQLIDKAISSDKPVILVTGEKKDDWWLKSDKGLVSALPALSKEFMSAVNQDFYLYSTDRFLLKANDYLMQNTSVGVVEEVRAINKADAESKADDEEEALIERAILDQAVNVAWPAAASTERLANGTLMQRSWANSILQDRLNKLLANEGRFLTEADLVRKPQLHFLMDQRAGLQSKMNELQVQLKMTAKEFDELNFQQQSYLSAGGSKSDQEFMDNANKMLELVNIQEVYRHDLMTVRNQLLVLIARQRKLMDE